jgi:hypothetical protein
MTALYDEIIANPDALKQVAARALKNARTSHQWFVAIRDTVDGRPIQAVHVGGEDGGPVEVDVRSAREKLMALLGGDLPDDPSQD